jgi:hypothetical protein
MKADIRCKPVAAVASPQPQSREPRSIQGHEHHRELSHGSQIVLGTAPSPILWWGNIGQKAAFDGEERIS